MSALAGVPVGSTASVRQLRVAGTGLQPRLHDKTTRRTDPAGSTLATPDFGPKDGVHLSPGFAPIVGPPTETLPLPLVLSIAYDCHPGPTRLTPNDITCFELVRHAILLWTTARLPPSVP